METRICPLARIGWTEGYTLYVDTEDSEAVERHLADMKGHCPCLKECAWFDQETQGCVVAKSS